jgi:hypothetical protein
MSQPSSLEINKIDFLGPVSLGFTDIGHDMLYRGFRYDQTVNGNLELDMEQESLSGLFGISVVVFEDDRVYQWGYTEDSRHAQLQNIVEDEKAKRLVARATSTRLATERIQATHGRN